MNTHFANLLRIGVAEEICQDVIDYFDKDKDVIKSYLVDNFEKANTNNKNKWIPAFVFYDLIISKFPDTGLTRHMLGRKLSELGIKSKYNHMPELGRSCSGYYLEANNNISNHELSKFFTEYKNKL